MIYEKIDFEYAVFMTENNFNISFKTLNNYLKENNYIKDKNITTEGISFLNNHPLHYYEKYNMDIVDYTKFEEYYWKNSNLDGNEICLKFLERYDGTDVDEIKEEIKKNS